MLRLPNGVLQEEQADIKAISTLRDLCGFGFVGSSACLMFGVCNNWADLKTFFFFRSQFCLREKFLFSYNYIFSQAQEHQQPLGLKHCVSVCVCVFFMFVCELDQSI